MVRRVGLFASRLVSFSGSIHRLPVVVLGGLFLFGCEAPVTTGPVIDPAQAEAEAVRQEQAVREREGRDARTYADQLQRFERVTYRVKAANSDLCPSDTGPIYGFTAYNRHVLPLKRGQANPVPFSLGEELVVVDVVADSPSALAGLAIGDLIRRVNGDAVPVGKDAAPGLVLGMWKLSGPVTLSIVRQGTPQDIAFTPAVGCQFGSLLVPDDVRNASANGVSIFMFTGMMEFFETEEELALVVAHELAHNSMDHLRKLSRNRAAGGLGGLLIDLIIAVTLGVDTGGAFTNLGADIGTIRYSIGFEKEADYVGMYMMARAGYDVTGAAELWRRMAAENPESIRLSFSHPTTPERFLALTQTATEIIERQQSGQALRPDIEFPDRKKAAEQSAPAIKTREEMQ